MTVSWIMIGNLNIKIPLMFYKWFKCNKHISWNLDVAKVKDFWDLKNALHFSDAQKLHVNKCNFVVSKTTLCSS